MFELDFLWGSLNQLFGNTILIVVLVLIVLFVMLFMARLPIYFAFLFSLPALFGFASAGIFGLAGNITIWIVVGLIFGMIAVRAFTDQTGFW